MALEQNGRVWTWGSNSYGGQLGDNMTIDRTTAVPVMDLPPSVGIVAGSFHTLVR